MSQMIYVVILFFIAVLIQSTTGFGASLIVMTGLPLVYTLAESMVLKTCVNIITITFIVYTYRKHISFKLLTIPVLSSLIFNYIGVYFLGRIDNASATLWLGLLLFLLSLYFFFFANRIHMPTNTITAIICGGISGLLGGMVGIGGPPIVLYYSAAIKDKNAYMATLQSFFWINGVSRLFFFAANITIDMSVLKVMPIAITVSITAAYIGSHIYKKMPTHVIRKAIYTMMGVAGLFYMFR